MKYNFSKFSYPGEGHIPSPGPYPCAISSLQALLRWTQQFIQNLAPPLEILCPRLDIAKIYEIINISCKQSGASTGFWLGGGQISRAKRKKKIRAKRENFFEFCPP